MRSVASAPKSVTSMRLHVVAPTKKPSSSLTPGFKSGGRVTGVGVQMRGARMLTHFEGSPDLTANKFSSLTEMVVNAMANIRPNRTGLPMVIFVSCGLGAKHGPRIKVSTIYGQKVPSDGTFFSITVAEEPTVIGATGDIKDQDVELAKNFVRINMPTLMAIWNQDVGVDEVIWTCV